MTHEELKDRQQNWTLQEKIDHSLFIIETFASRTDHRAYVLGEPSDATRVLVHLTMMVEPDAMILLSRGRTSQVRRELMAIGYRPMDAWLADNDARRNLYVEQGGCINESVTLALPLAIWTDADIKEYIKGIDKEF